MKSDDLDFELVKSINSLTTKMFTQMTTMTGSHVYSPLSIAIMMCLLQTGSKNNTLQQLVDTFGLKIPIEDLMALCKNYSGCVQTTSVAFVNKNYGVLKEYTDKLATILKLESVDTSSAQEISATVKRVNDFVSASTSGLIPSIISDTDIDLMTIVVLANTICFKCDWLEKFKSTNTKPAAFEGVADAVQMMTSTEYCNYTENSEYQLLEKKFYPRDFCMGFILPKSDSKFELTLEMLSQELYTTYVEMYIPKLKLNQLLT